MASSQNIHIPPGLPRESGPLYSDFFEQQVAKQRNNNYHSTSLVNMVATSVNRTALHPGGVQYVFLSLSNTSWRWQLTVPDRVTVTLNSRKNSTSTHTLTTTVSLLYVFCDTLSLDSALAYTDCFQIANPSVPALYEDALVYETGSAITSSGALSAYSGAKTGRSPSDKRIVKEESSEKDVWWGPVNKPMTTDVSFLCYIFLNAYAHSLASSQSSFLAAAFSQLA